MALLIRQDFSRGDSLPGVLGVLGIDGILRSQNLPRISAHLSLHDGKRKRKTQGESIVEKEITGRGLTSRNRCP